MRIAVFPKGQLDELVVRRSMTVFDWIDMARTLPVDGLELYSRMFDGTSKSFVDQVGDSLAAAGFEMPMLCASPDFSHPDPGVRARELDAEAEMIRVTARLGGPGASCRVLSGQRHPGVPVEQGLSWAAESITSLLPLAHELGVTLAVENHYKDGFWRYPELAQAQDVFLELLDRIGDRVAFGVQYDPSNAILAGDDPVQLLERVVDRVVTMQASDRSLAPGTSLAELRMADGSIGYPPALQHGVIGRGLVDYPRVFSVLAEHGYDGWVSIEDGVGGMDDLAASVEFLRQARQRYFGGSTAVGVRHHDEARAATAGLRAPK